MSHYFLDTNYFHFVKRNLLKGHLLPEDGPYRGLRILADFIQIWTFDKKKLDPDPTVKKIPVPDPTLENNPDPDLDPTLTKQPGIRILPYKIHL